MRRLGGVLAIVAGVLLVAVSVIALIVAYDGARHGWASWRHAAPIPMLACAIGLGLIVGGVALLRRR